MRCVTIVAAGLVWMLLGACSGDSTTGQGGDAAFDTGGFADSADVTVTPDTKPGSDVVTVPDSAGPDAVAPDAQADTSSDAEAPCDGCFGSPCTTNDQCFSGFCVDGPEGLTCTQLCESSCPKGWACKTVAGAGGDPSFICIWQNVPYCRPCRADADCAHPLASGFKNRCVEREDGSGSFCGTECDTNEACPVGASCSELVLGEETASLCQPDDGQCACNPVHIEQGASTDCAVINDAGSCDGARMCAAAGLSACDARTPAAEACNAADDDCDGLTDEGFEELGQACDGEDDDECEDGVWTCKATGLVCNDNAASKLEVCNGFDDDCDGEADESFKAGGDVTFTDANGTEGLVLGDGCGSGKCTSGTVVCSPDGKALQCAGGAGGSVEFCNGLDDDCDGKTDEDFKAGGEVTLTDLDGTAGLVLGDVCGAGACAGGEVVCGPQAAQLVCSTHGSALQEACNTLDDDCDGQTDEALTVQDDLAKLAAAGCAIEGVCGAQGATVASCTEGEWSCEYKSAAYEVVEVSCDNKDNDCDGENDELPSVLDAETLAALGCLAQGVCANPGSSTAACNNGTWNCTYNHPAYQVAETRCDGFDNDCDGQTDPDGIEECQKVFEDADEDGFGNVAVSSCQCFPGEGWVKNDDDCYGDANISVNPDHTSWETGAHTGSNFDWNCDKLAEKRFNQSVGKCAGKLSTDLTTFDLCLPQFGGSDGWRGAPAACGTSGDWHEPSDCQIGFFVASSQIQTDEDSIGCIPGIGCIAVCEWKSPSPKDQECR